MPSEVLFLLMALETTIVETGFIGGLGQKFDERSAPTVKLQKNINGQYNKIGRIDKRHGFSQLITLTSDLAVINSSVKIMSHHGQLLLADGHKLYSYSESLGRWVNQKYTGIPFHPIDVNRLPEAHLVSSNTVIPPVNSCTVPDVAVIGTTACYVWSDTKWLADTPTNTAVMAALVDLKTNALMFPPVQIGSSAVNAIPILPKVIALGTRFVITSIDTKVGAEIIWCNIADTTLDTATLITQLTASFAIRVFAPMTGNGYGYDITPANDGTTEWLLANAEFPGGVVKIHVERRKSDNTATLLNNADFTGGNTPVGIVATPETRLWIAYGANQLRIINSSTLANVTGPISTFAETQLSAIFNDGKGRGGSVQTFPVPIDQVAVVRHDATHCVIVRSTRQVGDAGDIRAIRVSDGGTLSTNEMLIRRMTLVSRPYIESGKCYAYGAYTNSQSSVSVYDSVSGVTYAAVPIDFHTIDPQWNYSDSIQATTFLLDLCLEKLVTSTAADAPRIVGRFAVGDSGGQRLTSVFVGGVNMYNGSSVSSVPPVSLLPGSYTTQFLVATSLISDQEGPRFAIDTTGKGTLKIVNSNFVRYSVGSLMIDMQTTRRYEATSLGPHMYFACCRPTMYDTERAFEVGFSWWPDTLRAFLAADPNAGGAASLINLTSYGYQAIYQAEDAAGQIHRSAPSPIFTGLYLDNNGATPECFNIDIPATRGLPSDTFSDRENYDIVLYRTASNGSTLNQLTLVPIEVTQGQAFMQLTQPLDEVATVSTPRYTLTIGSVLGTAGYVQKTGDSITDENAFDAVSIQHRPIIYTTGNILEGIAPGAATIVATNGKRIFLAGLEDPNLVKASTEWIDGEAVRFNEALDFRVGDGYGPITALARLDEKIVVFTTLAAFIVFGDGPDASGKQGSFQVERLTNELGCTEPRSVVDTPLGVFFQGAPGICLLNRSLAMEYIGGDVEDELASFPLITSAVLNADNSEVRITCCVPNAPGSVEPDQSQNGIVLIYNYLDSIRSWSVWQIANVSTTEGGSLFQGPMCPISSVMHKGLHYILIGGGIVMYEDVTTYLDCYNSFATDSHVATHLAATFVQMQLQTSWIKLKDFMNKSTQAPSTGLMSFQRCRRISLMKHTDVDAHGMSLTVSRNYPPGPGSDQVVTLNPYQNSLLSPIEQLSVHVRDQKGESIQISVIDTPPSLAATAQQYVINGNITLTGVPVAAYEIWIIIVAGGIGGNATYKYSLDGGKTFSGTINPGGVGTTLLGTTGLSITLTGTFIGGDFAKFFNVGPLGAGRGMAWASGFAFELGLKKDGAERILPSTQKF